MSTKSCLNGGNHHSWWFGVCQNCGFSRRKFDAEQKVRAREKDKLRWEKKVSANCREF